MKTLEIFNKHTGQKVIHDPNIISAMQEYATEYAKEALRLASENAEFIAEHQFYEETIKDRIDNVGSHLVSIDKHSILSENNLPKHR